MSKIPLIVIVGPTAVGKTDTAIALARALDGEIINADSMQVYKYMDIGTAKPAPEERQGVPHHLIDFLDPAEEFNVAQFQRLATEKIKDVYHKGKLPIVVGGSGLYVNSLVYPLNFTEASEDPDFRKQMQQEALIKGKEFLYNRLKAIDPLSASRIHPNDLRRIIRALEVYHLTGKTMSEYKQDLEKMQLPYNLVMIGLTMDRQRLYERINQRVDSMLQKGLVEEVKNLLNRGYNKDMTSMQALGYKEIIDYLEGKATFEETVKIIKRNTRRFAKRQFTWFRRDGRIYWIDVEEFPSKEKLVEYLKGYIKKKLSLK